MAHCGSLSLSLSLPGDRIKTIPIIINCLQSAMCGELETKRDISLRISCKILKYFAHLVNIEKFVNI